jgi:hypothetical protein
MFDFKKMKDMKKIAYILACAGLILSTACNDFLEEDSKTSILTSAFYKTEADAVSNVNSLYRAGAQSRITNFDSGYVGPQASVDQMLTGYFWNDYEGQERYCALAKNLERQSETQVVTTGYSNTVWDTPFSAINRANGAIKYIPAIEMDEALKTTLIAEAKFFRAYNYLYLIKAFGDVPLLTEPTESQEGIEAARTPVSEIYTLIESDLKEAVNVLPATTFKDNAHRITKYVAAMTLTDVYMRLKRYSEAATTIRIVTGAAGHSLTANEDMEMNSAFNQLRTTDDLPESIYAMEYVEGISTTGWLPSYSLWQGSTGAVGGAWAITQKVFGPINRFLNVYTEDDLRIQPNQFFHWKWEGSTGSIDHTDGEAGVWYYLNEAAMTGGSSAGTKDWNFYRYAEALLYAAEAIAESEGVNAEAAGYLAQIKARADMNGKTVEAYTTELQALAKDAFVEECWTERLREFPVEYKMWDDITRTGMFPNISETEKGKVEWVSLVGAANGLGKTFKAEDLYWPVPLSELQRNSSLVQNDGYAAQ